MAITSAGAIKAAAKAVSKSRENEKRRKAAAFAREAVTDALDFSNAHASIIAKHRKMFLQRAFGIAPDGTVIEFFVDKLMIHCLLLILVIYINIRDRVIGFVYPMF